MPAETLRAEIGKHRKSMGWSELFDLKRIFGVSVQALTYRCKDLGIFENVLFRLLFSEFTRRGWRRAPYKEPWAMPGERPMRFERLCFRALAEGAISEAKASELLGHSVHELNRRMDETTEIGGTFCQSLSEVHLRSRLETMALVKSFAVGNGDMFYIQHGSDNFSIIDCSLPANREVHILDEIEAVKKGKSITRFISTPSRPRPLSRSCTSR